MITAYKNILSAISSDDKEKWRNKFTWELARHSVSEELVVYPQFEKLLPDGKDMTQKDREEHLKVKKLLNQFQDMQPEHADFEIVLQNLWSQLSEHIKEEEHHGCSDLVALEKALDQAHSEKLVKSFNRTKMFAPTRSHPHAPNKPPFETVAGLIAAPIDRLRDIFRSFPEETKGRPPP
ncbi:hypothetical protein RRF57_007379 [Xylaria bambusicola]|uniref:Hemerythrin-like domain-containing protein n=1 Tax=Xylaria bambusicola TaxID=326684 RepID=A0AAN7UG30_9PEZI